MNLFFGIFHILYFSFIGVVILNWVDPALLLSLYAVACTSFAIAISQVKGHAGIGCLFMLFFFESICYPCIFTLGTKNLGVHTKRGSSLIVMVCTPLVSLLFHANFSFREWEVAPGTHPPKEHWPMPPILDGHTSFPSQDILP